MSEKTVEELYFFYRILTLFYKIKIDDSSIFLDYIYNMDIMLLSAWCCPYLWEDYIFVDDDLINGFKSDIKNNPTFKMEEFDNLSEFSNECLDKILEDGLVQRVEMNHIDYIITDGIGYYEERRDINLYFLNDNYRSRLIEKKRDVILSKLMN